MIVAEYPQVKRYDNSLLEKAKVAFELISQVRNTRSSKGLSPKEKLKLFIKAEDQSTYQHFEPIISKLANLESMEFTSEKVDNAISFLIKSDECFIPMEGAIDVEKEIAELQKELAYNKGFLKSVEKKLSNERFVSNAPEQVIAMEKKKQADAEAKIKTLEASLANLNG